MSRDRGDANSPDRSGPETGPLGSMTPGRSGPETGPLGSMTRERDAELLTAYVDGVAELPHEERHRIEAWISRDPEARADADALRALLGSLRDLPPDDVEPDWTAMAQSIHAAVGPDVPRPWWRSWKWLVPLTTCAATAVLLVMWPRMGTSTAPIREPGPAPIADHGVRDPDPRENIVALWLDGTEVDVDLSAADLLGGVEIGEDDPSDTEGTSAVGLLPATNLAGVDSLDEEALARMERWLAAPARPEGPEGPEGSESLESPESPERKNG